LYAHRSWARVLFQFLFDPDIDLYSRITRDRSAEHEKAAA
jgi:hypothetical protein